MAKFKTSINLYDAVNRLKEVSRQTTGDFFVVIDSFDFGRDVNGNTINKYRATLHRGDLLSVQNGYTGFGVTVLESPRRREQSHNEGQSAALYWLEKIGYDLAYQSMTYAPHTKKQAYRHVYRVTNNYLKAV
ncbi:hypothetical protein X824_gp126 [Escherichia phage 4MG]|uniref:Hyphothetical protein n=1 Tax=Escherichia phage 4MG TaxID=1391428 RepID=V5KT28_9CAUD|nr:hypothetical protein X824_gp126 [Escherichia phage 4MG]AGZ17697.1 hyphothetical protein [Escherichia phage 4MG]